MILLEKKGENFYDASSKDGLFGSEGLFGSITDVKNFNLANTNWTAWLNAKASDNQSVYNAIVGSHDQTGCTGIVTIPNAGETYDKTYGDLLLQAVIDCNFKLH